MPEELLRFGAGVRCTDGACGTIKSVVIDPGDDSVTHLIVEPGRWQGAARLVPFGLVEDAPAVSADGEVRLRCAMAEFGELDAAEVTELVPGDQESQIYAGEPMISWPYYAPPGVMGSPGLPPDPVVGEQA